MIGRAVLAAFAVLWGAPSDAAWDADDLKGAKGIEGFSVSETNFDTATARACGLSKASARASIINVVVPAGVPIASNEDKFTVGQLAIGAPTLYFENSKLCVSSLAFRVYRYSIYEWNGEKLLGLVELYRGSQILSSPAGDHAQRVTGQIREYATQFLAFWREANPDAARSGVRSPTPDASGAASSALALTKSQISDIQRRLQQLSLYQGSIDGALGPATKSAVRSFQTSKGLLATGNVDWTTLQVLFRE